MLLLALFACGEDPDTAASFSGGKFTFTTVEVIDTCTDQAFEVLLMPEGAPTDWQNPVELPSSLDVPATYEMQIQEPYGTVLVTVTMPDKDHFAVAGATALGVEFDPEAFPGCVVDNYIDADLTIASDNSLTGSAYMDVTNIVNDAGTCPLAADNVSEMTDCSITIDFTAARIEDE